MINQQVNRQRQWLRITNMTKKFRFGRLRWKCFLNGKYSATRRAKYTYLDLSTDAILLPVHIILLSCIQYSSLHTKKNGRFISMVASHPVWEERGHLLWQCCLRAWSSPRPDYTACKIRKASSSSYQRRSTFPRCNIDKWVSSSGKIALSLNTWSSPHYSLCGFKLHAAQ